MMVLQMVSTLLYGDAVGNDVLALGEAIKEMGYETAIYTDAIDARLPEEVARKADALPDLGAEDVMIYHMAGGTRLNKVFAELKCKKVMVYHNITPPEFFEGYDAVSKKMCQEGYEQLRWLSDKVDYCLADSEQNKKDLIENGFQCKIDVLPIVIPFEDYDKKPSEDIINRYKDGFVNILFVGRIVPHKKHEDVVKAFYEYKKHYNHKARLIFVGSGSSGEKYYRGLQRYIEELGVEDVVFPGHINFSEVLGFYHVADVFLCQSEHEGFCVPLVEAMYLNIPIIAYASTAIPGTLNGSGILMDKKDPLMTAGMIHQLMTDEQLKKTVLENQKERLADFDNEVVKKQFAEYFRNEILSMKKA